MKRLKKLIAVITAIALMVPSFSSMAATSSPTTTTLTSSNTTISLSRTSYTYDGDYHCPSATVTVTENGTTTTLVKGTDYTVTASGKKDVGTYTVTINGIGKYTGSVKAKYKITSAALTSSNTTIKLSKTSYTYDGEYHLPAVTVTYADGTTTTLVKGTDYTVTASGKKNVGTYTVTIKGTGNYSGTLKAKYKIVKASQSSVKVSTTYSTKKASAFNSKSRTYNVKVSGVKDNAKVTYTSSTSKIKVWSSGKIMILKGIKKGTYKITVKVAATSNYKAYTKTITIKVS